MGSIRDERRTRNFVGVAVFVLVLLYTVKLSFPGHSVSKAYTAVSSYIPSSTKQPSIESTDEAEVVCPAYCMPIPVENTTITWETTEETNTTELNLESATEAPNPSTSDLATTFNSSPSDPAKKVAVIIENRPLMNVIPLIMHFAGVLGEDWPIIVYTKAENIGLFSASAAFQRLVKVGRIEMRTLPLTVLIDNSESVSLFLTKPWFWESLAPAEHVLMFQSDSMLCSNAARSVDDFIEWDFIGAPIAKGKGAGYNGGLSLRRRSKILEVISKWDFSNDPAIKRNRYLSYGMCDFHLSIFEYGWRLPCLLSCTQPYFSKGRRRNIAK